MQRTWLITRIVPLVNPGRETRLEQRMTGRICTIRDLLIGSKIFDTRIAIGRESRVTAILSYSRSDVNLCILRGREDYLIGWRVVMMYGRRGDLITTSVRFSRTRIYKFHRFSNNESTEFCLYSFRAHTMHTVTWSLRSSDYSEWCRETNNVNFIHVDIQSQLGSDHQYRCRYSVLWPSCEALQSMRLVPTYNLVRDVNNAYKSQYE